MKNYMVSIFSAGFRFRTVLILLAALVVGTAGMASSDADSTSVKASINKAFPKIQVGEVSKTDVDGMFEVVSEGHIFYYHLKTGTIFTGEMVRNGRSMTAVRKGEMANTIFKGIPLSSTVQIGKGKKTVIEFSDPDCPFCRRVDEFLAKRNDVTIRLFLYPLSFHKDARKKSLQVLCADDGAEAYRDVMAGKYDKSFNLPDGCEAKNSARLDQHIELANKLGVNGTPAFWINGERVDGADIKRLEQLLADKI
jgi:thiol:disulfide interchange protein DsbC